jgi:hypothetical protein
MWEWGFYKKNKMRSINMLYIHVYTAGNDTLRLKLIRTILHAGEPIDLCVPFWSRVLIRNLRCYNSLVTGMSSFHQNPRRHRYNVGVLTGQRRGRRLFHDVSWIVMEPKHVFQQGVWLWKIHLSASTIWLVSGSNLPINRPHLPNNSARKCQKNECEDHIPSCSSK